MTPHWLRAGSTPWRHPDHDAEVVTHSLYGMARGWVDTLGTPTRERFLPGLWAEGPAVQGEMRIIVYNGVGTGYGDLICGSVALRALHERYSREGLVVSIGLVHEPTRGQAYRDVFAGDPHVRWTQPGLVPWRVHRHAQLLGSTEELLVDPEFDRTPMIEYFMRRLGVEPHECTDRLPRLYPDAQVVRDVAAALKRPASGRRVVALNVHASNVRRLPIPCWMPLVRRLVRDGWHVWMTAPEVGREPQAAWFARNKAHEIEHLQDWAAVSCQSWHHYVGVLSAADAVVSVDSSAVHVAGALRKPCVGLFFTIDPGRRINNYPTVRGYAHPAWRNGPFWTLSKVENRPLDERDTDWVALWERMSVRTVCDLLGRAAA